jgi:hypothetical protein
MACHPVAKPLLAARDVRSSSNPYTDSLFPVILLPDADNAIASHGS